MDARRHLNGRPLALATTGLLLTGCGHLGHPPSRPPAPLPAAAVAAAIPVPVAPAPAKTGFTAMAPIPNPTPGSRTASASPKSPAPSRAPRSQPPRGLAGRDAIAAANAQARTTSRADGFVGGLQVFIYDPGRVYEVWTAPLRVTTLTLAPGETVVSKAAGDTVRWQIGETTSGEGAGQRTHVMIKPLERGLETNLVLATSQRVYLVQLKSGPPETFNAAVSWDPPSAPPSTPVVAGGIAGTAAPEPLVKPAGPLDARYRIAPRGRRPAWTPTSVMTDGLRTFLVFPAEVVSGEAPALFALDASGEAQLVNYRQQSGLWVVDRVLDRAELRLGDRRAEVVRIIRQGGRP